MKVPPPSGDSRLAATLAVKSILRPAWTPAPGSLPFDPGALAIPAAILAALALLGLLGYLGAATSVREHPGMAAAAALVIASLVAPGQAFAGGGIGTAIIKRWVTSDHLGNAVLFSDAGGATVKRRVFEPYGQVVAESTDTEVTPQLFTGQRYEGRSGLYDFRARWYDAETGRFLSVDPVVQDVADPQTHNGYGYVRNNPVNLVDPSGMVWWVKLVEALTFLSFAFAFTPLWPVSAALSLVAAAVSFANNPSWYTGVMLAGAAVLTVAGMRATFGAATSPLQQASFVTRLQVATPALMIGETALPLANVAAATGALSSALDPKEGRNAEPSQSEPQAQRDPTVWPTKYKAITDPFDPTGTLNPAREGQPHLGVDIKNPLGEPVFASDTGEVLDVYYNERGGNQIRIRDLDRGVEGYAHTRPAEGLSPGQKVRAGDVIGYSDASGRVRGPHLHFTYRPCASCARVDPSTHLPR